MLPLPKIACNHSVHTTTQLQLLQTNSGELYVLVMSCRMWQFIFCCVHSLCHGRIRHYKRHETPTVNQTW